MQETYARVLARPRLLRNEDELGFLVRSMRNTFISQLRARDRRPQTTELVEEVAVSRRASDNPAEAAEIREVHAAIAELPDEFETHSSRSTSPASPTRKPPVRSVCPRAR